MVSEGGGIVSCAPDKVDGNLVGFNFHPEVAGAGEDGSVGVAVLLRAAGFAPRVARLGRSW